MNITLNCVPATLPPPDADSDGVPDASDNCPTASNPGQADDDGDGIGNVCDTHDNRDYDSDGVFDTIDNCPWISNPGQADLDGDLQGDACDQDDDQDGNQDWLDNCPLVQGTNQGCPLPGSLFVTTGVVTVPAGQSVAVLCPAGYVLMNLAGSYSINFTGGSTSTSGTDYPERTGIRTENQSASGFLTGSLSIACFPAPPEILVSSGVVTVPPSGGGLNPSTTSGVRVVTC